MIKTAQLASLPDREGSLYKTVLSLMYQVDELYVMLNGYDHIPYFLNAAKIHPYLLDNSLGDAAKFYDIEKRTGYIFTCDDDIIYPSDYTNKMSIAIEKYHCPVSLHGRNFNARPVRSYYHSATKKFRCLGQVDEDVKVDVGGTGVMAWFSNDLKVKAEDFPVRNMADIWFAKLCHEQNKSIMCLAHEVGYLNYIHPVSNIYDNSKDDDSTQTIILNSFLK